MSPLDFVIWLKGFVKASNPYNITPKQWDFICEELDKVKIPSNSGGYTISTDTGRAYGVTNTTAEKRDDVTYKNDYLTTNTLLHD